jgi:Rps23 Pro-64 3,4-dihydroxylase Tpa1-like proline 4-hydroxylase
VFAFQDPRIVEIVAYITGIRRLEPDAELYAGGISIMGRGHFLNPHVDNSHDNERERYRVLNLLYYVSPDWTLENGGNFEMWPQGIDGAPLTVMSRFNRLLVMETSRDSWHSVNRVEVDRSRCCVSNYYFSPDPPGDESYFHVTSFRGRPGQAFRDLVLRADSALRMLIRKFARKGIAETRHIYRKKAD